MKRLVIAATALLASLATAGNKPLVPVDRAHEDVRPSYALGPVEHMDLPSRALSDVAARPDSEPRTAGAFTIHVVSAETQAPIVGAEIYQVTGDVDVLLGRTSVSGEVSIQIDVSFGVTIAASHPDYVTSYTDISLTADGSATIELAAGATIHGRVERTDGAPPGVVQVVAWPRSVVSPTVATIASHNPRWKHTETQPDGSFSIRGVKDNETIEVIAGGMGLATVGPPIAVDTPSKETHTLTLCQAYVAGIEFYDGSDIAGIWDGGRASPQANAWTNSHSVEVEAAPTPQIVLACTDPEDRRRIAQQYADQLDGRDRPYFFVARSQSYGAVIGQNYCDIWVPGYSPSSFEFTIAPLSLGVQWFRHDLVRSTDCLGTLSVTLTDASGNLIEGVNGMLFMIDKEYRTTGRWCRGGRFSVGDVPCGEYRVRFEVRGSHLKVPGKGEPPLWTTVLPGQTTDIRLVGPDVGSIQFEVDSDVRRGPGQVLRVTLSDRPPSLKPDGSIREVLRVQQAQVPVSNPRLDGIPSGSYWIWYSHPGLAEQGPVRIEVPAFGVALVSRSG